MATSRPCLSTVSPATAVLDFSTWRDRAARFQGTWSAGICSAQAVERRMAVIRMSSSFGSFCWAVLCESFLLAELDDQAVVRLGASRTIRKLADMQRCRRQLRAAEQTNLDEDKRQGHAQNGFWEK